MFGTTGEVAVVDVLEHGFPGRLAVFVDGDGSESGGATCLTKFRPIAGLCAMRKVLGYVWLKSLPPLSYESVQTSFVPKTHADAGLFLLLKAAELSREWQSEVVVVQLDAKKAFDHVDHRAAFQDNETARCEFVHDGLDCGNLEWNGDVKQSSDESRIASRSAGISSHLHGDHGIGAARLDKELDFTETSLETGRPHAGCDLLCGRCGVDCCFDVCCRNNVSEVIEKLKEVGLTVGAQKTHWTSFSKMMDEFVGSMVCLDGNATHAIAHRTAQANKCRAKWKLVLNSPWLPRLLRLHIVKTTMWQAFLWSSSVWTTVKAQRDEIASWSARMVANVVGSEKTARNGAGTVVEPLAQDWSSMDREMQYECAGGHQGSYAQLGWTCGKAGLQRNLCDGSEMSRPSIVEMETAKMERGGERQNGLAHTHNGSKSTGGRTWLLGRSPNLLETQMVCRKLSKTTRDGCVLLKTVEGGSNSRNVERALYRWSRVPRDPSASGMTGTIAVVAWLTEKSIEREIWRATCYTSLDFKPTGTLP